MGKNWWHLSNNCYTAAADDDDAGDDDGDDDGDDGDDNGDDDGEDDDDDGDDGLDIKVFILLFNTHWIALLFTQSIFCH